MQINAKTKTAYLTLDLIRLILVEELGFDQEEDEDRVMIYNQKFVIPKKTGMFIYLEPKGAPKIISSRNRMENDGLGNFNENQNSSWLEDICIGVYSQNLEAIQRKEEVAMALHSVYSQQLQEAQSFKVFRNVNIIPINEIEGPARLYRFDVECKVFAWYNKVKLAEFFDTLNVEVRVNDGVPDLVEDFVIPTTDPTKYPKT